MRTDGRRGARRGAQHGHSLASLGIVTALILGVASFGTIYATGRSDSDRTCAVSETLVNPCRPWLGAWANDYPQASADVQAQTRYHEQRIGRSLDIVHTYHPIGSDELSPADIYFANRPHTLLFTNWKPAPTWADIVAHNAGIDRMAASIKALAPHKIFLTLWHEPELDVSPGGDPNCPDVAYEGSKGTVADYRVMWQYIEKRFAADGVTNVVWVMNYMGYHQWDCLVPDLWPGNDLVDWVMFDPYSDGGSSSFTSVVGRFTKVLTEDSDSTHDFLSKPWGLGEWGAFDLTPGQERAFIEGAKHAVDDNTFPNIHAYVVFDADPSRVGYDDDGKPDPGKADAYTSFAQDSSFSGTWQGPTAAPVALNP